VFVFVIILFVVIILLCVCCYNFVVCLLIYFCCVFVVVYMPCVCYVSVCYHLDAVCFSRWRMKTWHRKSWVEPRPTQPSQVHYTELINLHSAWVLLMGLVRSVEWHFFYFHLWTVSIKPRLLFSPCKGQWRNKWTFYTSSSHALGGVSGLFFYYFHWWTVSIKLRLLFSQCKLCFLRIFLFLRLIVYSFIEAWLT